MSYRIQLFVFRAKRKSDFACKSELCYVFWWRTKNTSGVWTHRNFRYYIKLFPKRCAVQFVSLQSTQQQRTVPHAMWDIFTVSADSHFCNFNFIVFQAPFVQISTNSFLVDVSLRFFLLWRSRKQFFWRCSNSFLLTVKSITSVHSASSVHFKIHCSMQLLLWITVFVYCNITSWFRKKRPVCQATATWRTNKIVYSL